MAKDISYAIDDKAHIPRSKLESRIVNQRIKRHGYRKTAEKKGLRISVVGGIEYYHCPRCGTGWYIPLRALHCTCKKP